MLPRALVASIAALAVLSAAPRMSRIGDRDPRERVTGVFAAGTSSPLPPPDPTLDSGVDAGAPDAGPSSYSIIASAGTGGGITPTGTVTVATGGAQTFTIGANSGYAIASVSVDGTSVGAVTTYTFSSVTANHTIAATFIQQFSLVASAGSNGSVSPSGTVTVNSGGSQTFNFTPATGYQVASVQVDGSAVTTANSYTFSNVSANHTLSVAFSLQQFTLTSSAGSNGTISPSGTTTVNYGGSQTYTFTPSTGYNVASVLVDGTSVGTPSSYTFSGVAANHTVSVSFSNQTFTLTSSAGSNGSISPSGTTSVNYGASQTFTFTPSTGYQVASVLVDGTSVGSPSSYTFSSVTANHTISVSFAIQQLTITSSAGSNGTISPSGSTSVNYGGSQGYTITPATGYNVASVLVDGTSVGAVNSYTFSNVTSGHTISATFAVQTFAITSSSGSNGSISPSGTTSVNYGGSVTYTFTPAMGYQVATVTVDGSAVATASSYTFTNVTATHTIAVTFGVSMFVITPSAGSNGAISPSTMQSVAYGGNQTFNFTPSTGYRVSSISVDGTVTGSTASSYTFTNVMASHMIAVAFAVQQFTITSSVGSNGTVSPSGATTVNYGASQTFTFTPSTGYQVASLTVDGSPVTTANSYTFSGVTANHTIAATFSQIQYTITPAAGSNGSISPSTATTVAYGGSQTFTFTPSSGYSVSNVVVDGTSTGTTPSSYTFSSVTANHTITVSFAASSSATTFDFLNTGPAMGSNPVTATSGQTVSTSRAATKYYCSSNPCASIATLGSNATIIDAQGLLVEPAHIQLARETQSVGQFPWYSAGSPPTSTANSTAAPDGTTTASTLTWPSATTIGSSSNFWEQDESPNVASQVYTFSIWLKQSVTITQMGIYVRDNSAVGGVTLCTVSSTWSRCQAAYTSPATGGSGPEMMIGYKGDLGGSATYPAGSVYTAFPALEKGSVAHTYFPNTSTTSASTTTAAADVVTFPASALTTSGSETVTVIPNWTLPATSAYVYDTQTGTAGVGWGLFISTTGVISYQVGGSTVASSSALSWVAGTSYALVVTHGSGGALTVTRNGTLVFSTTGITPPTSLGTSCYLGADHTGANQFDGHLKAMTFTN